jgi:hypothetical protein
MYMYILQIEALQKRFIRKRSTASEEGKMMTV